MGAGYKEAGFPKSDPGKVRFQLESPNVGWMLDFSWMNIPSGSLGSTLVSNPP